MIITISGKPGSGKSTVAKLLSKKIKYRFYSAGDIRRIIARKKGISLEELNRIGEKKEWTDKIVDDFMKRLAKKDKIVVESRLAWHFIPNSIKFFLDANPRIRAKRIFESKRKEEKYKNIKESMEKIKQREKSDTKRYRKYYGIKNCYDKRHFDYVINTTQTKPKEVVSKILKIIRKEAVSR